MQDVESLGLVMSNGVSAVDTINEMATAIFTLEQNVMKWAKSVSERFQSKEGVEKKKRDTANINAQIDRHIHELLQRPCIPSNRADADALRQDYAVFRNHSQVSCPSVFCSFNRVVLQILRELVKTYTADTIRCMDSLLDVDYRQTLKQLLEEVQTRFARYDQTRASREKLVGCAYDYYYCLETVIPLLSFFHSSFVRQSPHWRRWSGSTRR